MDDEKFKISSLDQISDHELFNILLENSMVLAETITTDALNKFPHPKVVVSFGLLAASCAIGKKKTSMSRKEFLDTAAYFWDLIFKEKDKMHV